MSGKPAVHDSINYCRRSAVDIAGMMPIPHVVHCNCMYFDIALWTRIVAVL